MTSDTDGTTDSISISREELHSKVWAKPLARLADEMGVSPQALAKACDEHEISRPAPHGGYWTLVDMGRQPEPTPLSGAPGDRKMITLKRRRRRERLEAVVITQQASEVIKAPKPVTVRSTTMNEERVQNPHRLIAEVYQKRDDDYRMALRKTGWDRAFYMPKTYDARDLEMDKALNAILIALDKRGGQCARGPHPYFTATFSGVAIRFGLTWKKKNQWVPVEPHETYYKVKNGMRMGVAPTDRLRFAIMDHVNKDNREWVETTNRSMLSYVDDIVAAMIKAGQNGHESKIAQEEWRREYEKRRLEEDRQREIVRRDRDMWASFVEMAAEHVKAENVRRFIATIRASVTEEDADSSFGGKTVSQWLEWADDHLFEMDPLSVGVGPMFTELHNGR